MIPESAMRKRIEWRRRARDLDRPEVRQYTRIHLHLPVEYYGSNAKIPRLGHTTNLSPGGVMLNLPEKLDIGQSINLAIFVSWGKTLEAIKVNSQVIWVQGSDKDGEFRSGVKFMDLSANDRNKLERFFEK
jgi:c-di-GMP-binding flagellar brake protein YcgR